MIELRPIRPGGGRALKQEYFPTSDHDRVAKRARALRGDADVYFGVAPRSREAGTKDAVQAAWAAWVDLDTPEAATRLEDFELQPAIVVSSGSNGHRHAYWPLAKPAKPEAIERVNRALAERLGGDPACSDVGRVMRLPGTVNHKHDPPMEAKLVSATDRRYKLAELEAALALDAKPEEDGPVPANADSSPSEVGTGADMGNAVMALTPLGATAGLRDWSRASHEQSPGRQELLGSGLLSIGRLDLNRRPFGPQMDRPRRRLVPRLVPRRNLDPGRECQETPKARFRSGLSLVGAARFELATFRPPAGRQSVSMRPRAFRSSVACALVDDLDASDVAVGTKVVLRPSRVFVRQPPRAAGAPDRTEWLRVSGGEHLGHRAVHPDRSGSRL